MGLGVVKTGTCLAPRLGRWHGLARVAAGFALLVTMIGSNAVAEAKIVNRIIAKVNEEIITQGELDRLIREHVQSLRVYDAMPIAEARQLAESQAQSRLDDLIASTLLDQEARRQEEEDPTLQIGQLALDDAITAFRAEQSLQDEAEFRATLEEQGYTLATFHREMHRNLRIRELFRRTIFPKLNVTDEDVFAHYEAHIDEFADKQIARENLRELRFAEEREGLIDSLRDRSFVKTLVTF